MLKYLGKLSLIISFVLCMTRISHAKVMDASDYVRLGNSYFSNGQYEEAARSYKQALNVEPSNDAVYNLGITYHHRLNYFAKARHCYEQFLEKEPNAPESQQVKVWLKEVYNKVFPEESKDNPLFKKFTAQELMLDTSSNEIETQDGNNYLRQKKYYQAIQAYQKAFVRKNSITACLNLALLYDLELGYLQKAIFYYQKFLALAPNHPQVNQVADLLTNAKNRLKLEKGHFYQGTAFQLRQP